MSHAIPRETIGLLLEIGAFEHGTTKITEETVGMLQKYMEIFVREAVLRSQVNKEQVKKEQDVVYGKRDAKEIILTHEDLENVTGLLLLDM
ncbi:hypothetical protein HG537_0B05130 [Torulaspora globosa]|uniref:Uncharacterized protein n=1 Tax=Torulaspora globosa TaxID=48254 RepID=A0A7H9HS16_9SACH|nr:hypothetical protein HG537_0B05130 [Torulaspora sp. CBS 2947]